MEPEVFNTDRLEFFSRQREHLWVLPLPGAKCKRVRKQNESQNSWDAQCT